MAKLSSDGTYVIVEKGDTLWEIARDYLNNSSLYKQLQAINNIPNSSLIYPGQRIYLKSSGSSSSSSSSSSSTNKPTINQFGLQSNADGVLFATWNWSKSDTESYKVLWTYNTGDGVWFVGNDSTIQVDEDNPSGARQSLYTIPKNAKQVRFKVKPIAKKTTKNGAETSAWEASWSSVSTYTDDTPLATPSAPSLEIDKYTLTVTLDKLTGLSGKYVQFELVKDNLLSSILGTAYISTEFASYSCSIQIGHEYKVRCRLSDNNRGTGALSEWSEYSNSVKTIPEPPEDIFNIQATSETSVLLEWYMNFTAEGYELEYATKKEYFGGSNATTKISDIEFSHYEITGLETGSEYFFRVRSKNSVGTSSWSTIKSIVIGKKPTAPTTWSSTSTVIVGEVLTLYWIHNTEDGSSQTYADLELDIDGVKKVELLKNTDNEDEKDKTSMYVIDTSKYVEGTKIKWRVRTAGITNVFSDWSTQRTVDVYAPPVQELKMVDSNGSLIRKLTGFPFRISAIPGPKTQTPIGYHLTITADEYYETVDSVGNQKIVNVGDAVYTRYFDINTDLSVWLSAGDIDLENNIPYTITCVSAMDSGLTATETYEFEVNWVDVFYEPNAEIGLNRDDYTASIRPYCRIHRVVKRELERVNGEYVVTSREVGRVWGEVVIGTRTTTGELVYSGITVNNEAVRYAVIEETETVQNVLLSVYRREFDGTFTELAVGLDSGKNVTITDPHPALDYARYRIVAVTKDTGAVSYYDLPGYPVRGDAAIIQWDEEWSSFDTTEVAELDRPPWTGSLLRLPYNIDVSNSHNNDVTLVEYIGRSHPIGYYGTQVGERATWNMVIEKSDKETLYGLRRLAKWMGDVYVREPSGSGYWANVSVSFSQKHCEVTIPVTLEITRVEGGA